MDSTPLTEEERALLSARADAFHAALARGDGGDWNHYVAELPEHFRRIMLSELAIIDLVERWKNGETPLVEDYVARFPELGPVEEVPRALIVEECRCRARAGEQPSLDSYRSRFPRQFADI
ncbi:MAG TPA: hypothetical protein VLM40_03840, partial [Gemmata sp.]|nr:hypothetical protein [Gemmata sp.]